jgi:oxygen-dependent protoporphyrinogen oxidase
VQSWDAVVVGAGIGGLVVARDLAAGGLSVLVVEQRAEPGGAVARHEVAGLRLDAGAESFATRGDAVATLAAELGLSERVVAPESRGAWVQLPTGAGPLPRTGLLGIPSAPWAADVRRTVGTVGALRAALDRVLPTRVGTAPRAGTRRASPTGDGLTLGSLVRARMGRRVLDRLVRPVVAGVHAADPDDLAVDAVAPGLLAALAERGSLGSAVAHLRALAPAGAAVSGFDGGMHVLVDALLADLTDREVQVRTGMRVTAVRPFDGGPFEVTLTPARDGSASAVRMRADRLVLAAPDVGLLRAVVPGLEGLQPDPGADVVLVTLVLDAPALDRAPRGTGVLVAPGVGTVRAKALTHATAKWAWLARDAGPGRHVVRLSYGVAGSVPTPGDAQDPRTLDDAALTTLALRDASTLLGVPLRAEQLVASARVAWSQALPRPSAAHRATVTRIRAAVARVPGVAVCGAWVAGNGIASVVPDARRAAATLLSGARPATPSAR